MFCITRSLVSFGAEWGGCGRECCYQMRVKGKLRPWFSSWEWLVRKKKDSTWKVIGTRSLTDTLRTIGILNTYHNLAGFPLYAYTVMLRLLTFGTGLFDLLGFHLLLKKHLQYLYNSLSLPFKIHDWQSLLIKNKCENLLLSFNGPEIAKVFSSLNIVIIRLCFSKLY